MLAKMFPEISAGGCVFGGSGWSVLLMAGLASAHLDHQGLGHEVMQRALARGETRKQVADGQRNHGCDEHLEEMPASGAAERELGSVGAHDAHPNRLLAERGAVRAAGQ